MDLNPVQRNILEVALVEFANFGLEGSRVDAIASKTQTSKRMIYYHFGSKEGLYQAVLEYAYRSVREGEDLESLRTLPPLDALVRYISYAFNSFSAHPDFIRLSQQESLQGARFLKNLPTVRQMNQASLAILEGIVLRGKADGSMRTDVDPMHIYINYIGLCHYQISSRHNYALQFDFDPTQAGNKAARLASITDMLIRYVRT